MMGDMSFFDILLIHATLLVFASGLFVVAYMVEQRLNYHEDSVDYFADEEDSPVSRYLMTAVKHENRVYWTLTILAIVMSLGSITLSLLSIVNS